MATSVSRHLGLRYALGATLALAALAVLLLGCSSQAAYPSKAISLFIPGSPGGATELASRPVAEYLTKKWGQAINLEYKPGASGTQGVLEMLQAPADGYTILVIGNSQGTTNLVIQADLPYKLDQLAPIGRLVANPMAFVVPPSSPYKTMKALLDDVAKDPKKFKYGTQSALGPSALCTTQILKGANINPTGPERVVSGGGGPMITAVAGGHVDWAVGSISETIGLVQGGKLRALALSGLDQRWKDYDAPIAKEAGVPWFTWVGYTGIVASTKLPEAIVNKWADGIKEAVSDKDFLAKAESLGLKPLFMGPKDYGSFLKTEYDTTLAAAKELGLVK